ncbi:hypothetical protein [Horticoccus sp. 23ND18S-11]|uniref:hypothetical protein n=1 Tax=Horticoccus sp. 23ND18S-11 TaxID=3391832 RepID=UPI0039C8C4AA
MDRCHHGESGSQRIASQGAARNYELLAKRVQLATDAQGFVNTLVQGVQAFLQNSSFPADPCTIALTDRTGRARFPPPALNSKAGNE